jgi:diketogulonate reductase-like aldo/keto reductase
MMVHNLAGTDQLMPTILSAKESGRIRYTGISTSSDRQYDDLMAAMRRYPLDFIQIDYSIGNRSAAERVLPLAQERGIAVLINTPFGGRRNAASLFGLVADRPLPDFAADIDATSWAQVFLKFIIGHQAVTTAIPGMTQLRHLQDNAQAGFGRLPNAELRREIERYWDTIDV